MNRKKLEQIQPKRQQKLLQRSGTHNLSGQPDDGKREDDEGKTIKQSTILDL